jgi:hypothetical protein
MTVTIPVVDCRGTFIVLQYRAPLKTWNKASAVPLPSKREIETLTITRIGIRPYQGEGRSCIQFVLGICWPAVRMRHPICRAVQILDKFYYEEQLPAASCVESGYPAREQTTAILQETTFRFCFPFQ